MDKMEKVFYDVANELGRSGKLNGLTDVQKRFMIQMVSAMRLVGEALNK